MEKLIGRFIRFLFRRYVLRSINRLLKKHREDVLYTTHVIGLWIKRLDCITDQLSRINERVSDGEIDSKDIQDSLEEIRYMIQNF